MDSNHLTFSRYPIGISPPASAEDWQKHAGWNQIGRFTIIGHFQLNFDSFEAQSRRVAFFPWHFCGHSGMLTIVSVSLEPSAKKPTSQTDRDLQHVRRRILAVPPSQFATMAISLARSTKAQLLQRACSISRECGAPAPDRMARRHRDALICWYCQFCPTVTSVEFPPADSVALPFPEIPELRNTVVPDLLAPPSAGQDLCGWAF